MLSNFVILELNMPSKLLAMQKRNKKNQIGSISIPLKILQPPTIQHNSPQVLKQIPNSPTNPHLTILHNQIIKAIILLIKKLPKIKVKLIIKLNLTIQVILQYLIKELGGQLNQ